MRLKMLVTLESLLMDSLGEVVIENENCEYDFDFVETNMECQDILNDINTLTCASTITIESEDNSKNNGILKKLVERIKEFFKAIGKFFKRIFDSIKRIFTSQKTRIYDELLKHIESLPDDFKGSININQLVSKMYEMSVTGKDVSEFANDTKNISDILEKQTNRVIDPDQIDHWDEIINEIKTGVENYKDVSRNNLVHKALDKLSDDKIYNDGSPVDVEYDKEHILKLATWSIDVCKSYAEVQKSIKQTIDNFEHTRDKLVKFVNEKYEHIQICHQLIGIISVLQKRTTNVMLVLMNTNNFTLKLLHATGYTGKYKFADE